MHATASPARVAQVRRLDGCRLNLWQIPLEQKAIQVETLVIPVRKDSDASIRVLPRAETSREECSFQGLLNKVHSMANES